jgi:hypothetical protein
MCCSEAALTVATTTTAAAAAAAAVVSAHSNNCDRQSLLATATAVAASRYYCGATSMNCASRHVVAVGLHNLVRAEMAAWHAAAICHWQ